MGMWTGIKYALNSTLGTTKFKPLDKLLTDAIINQTQMIASDDVYLSLDDFEVSVANTETQELYHPTSLKATRNGRIRLKGTISPSSASAYSFNFVIYKNAEAIYSYATKTEVEFSIDTDVQINDVIRLYLYAKSSAGTASKEVSIESPRICGTLKINAFDYI